MCNHYANHPEIQKELQTWREYISWSLNVPLPPELAELDEDVWPKREAAVVRDSVADGGAVADIMRWGVPLSLPGKRAGSVVTKHVTNVRNLDSPFWRGMLTRPEQRCLVPFTRFAEPKMGAGREEHWFSISDQPLAAFAGVWRYSSPHRSPRAQSRGGEGQLDLTGVSTSLDTNGLAADDQEKVFAFLTCEPNPLVAPLHPKAMPVILHPARLCHLADCGLGGGPKAGAALSEPVDGGRVRRGIKGDRE
ncbi:MAG: SOS response-associated peptidase family protein [Sphingomonadales bacterium]|nr:SOS response-associated peptidase family protein [Sphingomonadales bacterium]